MPKIFATNKLRILRNKYTPVIALALVLTIASALITCVPVGAQQQYEHASVAFLFVTPNPIGVNQLGLVEAWITPRPYRNPFVYYNYKFTFTAPNGEKTYYTYPATEMTATIWFNWALDQVGNWTVDFSWGGEDLLVGGVPTASGNHTAASTSTWWMVQEEPIPSWPFSPPIPTDGWDWPINPENREWSQIGGAWWQDGYNCSAADWNPYTQAPASSHILWKHPAASGVAGIQAGQYGYARYFSSSRATINTIMVGRAYGTWGGLVHCIELRTGKELWTAKGDFDTGAFRSNTPVLLDVTGTRFVVYDGLTGAVTLNVTGSGATKAQGGAGCTNEYLFDLTGYVYQVTGLTANVSRLIKWSISGSTSTFASRIVYNKTYPFDRFTTYDSALLALGGKYLACKRGGIINATSGNLIVARNIELYDRTQGPFNGVANGLMIFGVTPMRYVAYDIKTWQRAYYTEQSDYPWGDFWAYSTTADNLRIYALSYAGVYAYNITNGKELWFYSSGDANKYGETPYGTWPFGSGSAVAGGGIVYAPTTEWGTPTPYYRGQKLHAIDAATGEGIWSIMGSWRTQAIAEGYVLAGNAYDGYTYCFGKGPTLTEISVLDPVIAKGDSAFIVGRITDQSPAQPGTPAVSKKSMSAWLQYLHMQQSMPTNTTGVPVTLYASRTDGTALELGTVTTDSQGYFRLKWTPPAEDQYLITAAFNGDESYFSSWNTTSLGVGAATPMPETPETPEYPVTPDYTPLLQGLIAAVAVVAVIGLVNLFWKRK